MAVGFLFLILHKEDESKIVFFLLPGISGRSSQYWSREHKILSYTAQYTKVYETGPSSRVVREAALGRRGWGVPIMSAEATLGFCPICLKSLARLGAVTLARPVNSQLPQFREISSRVLTQLAHQLVSFTGVEVERRPAH